MRMSFMTIHSYMHILEEKNQHWLLAIFTFTLRAILSVLKNHQKSHNLTSYLLSRKNIVRSISGRLHRYIWHPHWFHNFWVRALLNVSVVSHVLHHFTHGIGWFSKPFVRSQNYKLRMIDRSHANHRWQE